MKGRRKKHGMPRRKGPNVSRPYFEGPREEDESGRVRRLTGQILDVFNCMTGGLKRTLQEISRITGHPPASVSAQLRHLRKKRFGGFIVCKEHVGNGLYLYWIDFSGAKQSSRRVLRAVS